MKVKTKAFIYMLLSILTIFGAVWLVNIVLNPLFLSNLYDLGGSVVEMMGLPQTIG